MIRRVVLWGILLALAGACAFAAGSSEQSPGKGKRGNAESGSEQARAEETIIIARPQRFGNEPFTIVALRSQDGTVFAVHKESPVKAKELENIYYRLGIERLDELKPPPGLSAEAVVRILWAEKMDE
jgi:hypothetical protein